MSNRFSCLFDGLGENEAIRSIPLSEPYLTQNYCRYRGYRFFACAQPLVTSAAVEDSTVNSRFYYVKRLKLDYTVASRNNVADTSRYYMMVFVLNIPDEFFYVTPTIFRLSDLPSHKIPESVLYYDLVSVDQSITTNYVYRNKNIHIDITKPFKVLPSHRLAFYIFWFGNSEIGNRISEGSVEIFFDVN